MKPAEWLIIPVTFLVIYFLVWAFQPEPRPQLYFQYNTGTWSWPNLRQNYPPHTYEEDRYVTKRI